MNQFFLKISILFLCLISFSVFSQETIKKESTKKESTKKVKVKKEKVKKVKVKKEKVKKEKVKKETNLNEISSRLKSPVEPLKSMFTLGTGFYSFQGDISNEESNYLSGNIAYNAGMRFFVNDKIDFSVLFTSPLDFNEKSIDDLGIVSEFRSTITSFGAQLDFNFNDIFKNSRIHPFASLGIISSSFKTLNTIDSPSYMPKESSVGLPVGFGLMLDISNKMRFDAALKYTINSADIDHSDLSQSDNYMVLNFAVHYDLFTREKSTNIYDQKYYADVNYDKLDIADADGDLVADIDDYCPKTPAGIKVDENGCALDDDGDGIANYLDKEKNTKLGAIVDEDGVKLTDEKYFSMYSDVDPASREYSEFYNENEIKRDDFKTVNAYLIAKANAFNRLNNLNNMNEVEGVFYKVFLSQFSEGVPAKIINKLLSLDDLESMSNEDGSIIYAVGSYLTVDEALNREFNLEKAGFKNLDILEVNNGALSIYRPQIVDQSTELIDKEDSSKLNVDSSLVEKNNANSDEVIKIKDANSSGTVFRVQIGAFKVVLNDEVFSGVKNVISFKGNDGLTRYMTGSFTDYKDAVLYSQEMKARGFEDAFIVTYKDGEKVALNVAIEKNNKKIIKQKNTTTKKVKVDVSFRIQIGVFKDEISPKDLEKLSKISNLTKEPSGNFYKYYSSSYNNFIDASSELEMIKSFGFTDAFMIAQKDGGLISIEKARMLLNNN